MAQEYFDRVIESVAMEIEDEWPRKVILLLDTDKVAWSTVESATTTKVEGRPKGGAATTGRMRDDCYDRHPVKKTLFNYDLDHDL